MDRILAYWESKGWLEHPIWDKVRDKPLSSRTVLCIARCLVAHPHKHYSCPIAALDYDEFLMELAKPDGGKIIRIRNLGIVTLEELRRVCLSNDPVTYGYA